CLKACPDVCLVAPELCLFCIAPCLVASGFCAAELHDAIEACSKALKSAKEFCTEQPSTAQGPVDPNEKLVLARRYVQPTQAFIHAIHYENGRQVEAQGVFIRDVLDEHLDLASLQFLTPEGASLETDTRTAKWDLLGRSLPPGQSDSVMLSVKPVPGLPSGTE